MNCILKFGTSMCKNSLFNISRQMRPCIFKRKDGSAFSRTMWHMLPNSGEEKFLKMKPVTEHCQCGCSGLLHTKGEKSLVDFLKGEISQERKAQKMSSIPTSLDGFSIRADRAELFFKKENKIETITVSMNVTHSVDTDDVSEDSFSDEMKARPTFEIDITKNNSTLNFCCSYVNFRESEEEKFDVYQIDEVTLYEGEWNEKNYSVAGDILDENLYDLFMSLLYEKGITNEFMEQVSEIATSYEHSKYIGLLEEIRNFASAN